MNAGAPSSFCEGGSWGTPPSSDCIFAGQNVFIGMIVVLESLP